MSQRTAASLARQRTDSMSPEQTDLDTLQHKNSFDSQMSQCTSPLPLAANADERVGVWQKLRTAVAVISFILSWVLIAQSTPTEQGQLKAHKRKTVRREWAETIQLRPKIASIMMLLCITGLTLVAWAIRYIAAGWS